MGLIHIYTLTSWNWLVFVWHMYANTCIRIYVSHTYVLTSCTGVCVCVCVSHVAYPYPALAIPLTFLLIPNKKMTDKIITDDGEDIPDDSEDKALDSKP